MDTQSWLTQWSPGCSPGPLIGFLGVTLATPPNITERHDRHCQASSQQAEKPRLSESQDLGGERQHCTSTALAEPQVLPTPPHWSVPGWETRLLLLFSRSVMSDSETPWTAACQASLSFTIFQLLLLLSHFSCVQLCATPETAAHQAPHPWDSPGKNTGVDCHFLLQCMKVKSESEVAQSCPTLPNPVD